MAFTSESFVADLQVLAREYSQTAAERGFVGAEVMPVRDVDEKIGEYPYIPSENYLKIPNIKRAAGASYPRREYKFDKKTYKCQEYGIEEAVGDDDSAEYSRLFDLMEEAVNNLEDIILRAHEERVAVQTQTGAGIASAPVTNEWDDFANATCKSDVTVAKRAFRLQAGMSPNLSVCNEDVFENLLQVDEVKEELKYVNPITIQSVDGQEAQLSAYFSIPRFIVARGRYDTTGPGVASSTDLIWDDEYFSLLKVSMNPQSMSEVCFGKTLNWTKDSQNLVNIDTYREDQTRSEVVRVRHHVAEHIVSTSAAYNLTNITS
jgi:hypothetical protein